MRVTYCIFVSIFSCVWAYPNVNNQPTAGFIRNPPISLSQSKNGKIIGGNDTIPGEFPFQVSIQIQPIFEDRRHHCGGIILNPTHVIKSFLKLLVIIFHI
jgi:hypothetical protein